MIEVFANYRPDVVVNCVGLVKQRDEAVDAVANLEAHVDEVNALNVFPVPDGDTGSNMIATVRAALAGRNVNEL